MWQDSLWGWRLSCRYKNYDYVQVLEYLVFLKYKFVYWFFSLVHFQVVRSTTRSVWNARVAKGSWTRTLLPSWTRSCSALYAWKRTGRRRRPKSTQTSRLSLQQMKRAAQGTVSLYKGQEDPEFFASHMLGSFPNKPKVVNPVCSELVRMVRKFLYKVISWQTSYFELV